MTSHPENISNSGSGSGWSIYTMGKNNDREGATLICGDTDYGDKICNNQNYVRFVISFSPDDNVSPEKGREIVKEWFSEFMKGFDEDEYHLDLVEHTDTDILHYHARISKLNLLTGTQLNPYYHKADLNYIKAVNETIAEKYNLTLGTDEKQIVVDPTKVDERIQKWRDEYGQKPFDFSKKKERDILKVELNNFARDLVLTENASSLEGIKGAFEGNGYPVVNEGFDRTAEQHYLTVQDKNGKKLKLKGEIYNPEFHHHRAEEKVSLLCNSDTVKTKRRSKEIIEKNLSKWRAKRNEWIEKQYGSARAKARKRIEQEKAKILSTPKPKINKKEDSDTYTIRARERIRDIQNRRRRKSVATLLADAHRAKQPNHRAIGKATQGRTDRREIGDHLNRLIQQIGNKFEQLTDRLSRKKRDRRGEDRTVGREITTSKPSKKKKKPKKIKP